MSTITRGLHWFRHDLRVNDNDALLQLSEQTNSLIGVYVFDPRWHDANQWGCVHLGAHRHRFIESALADLKARMQNLGADLLIIEGKPMEQIRQLVTELNISHVSYEQHAGFNESTQIHQLKNSLSSKQNVEFIEGESGYLYAHADLPFALENMPDTFSPFRRKVEKYAIPRLPLACPSKLAPLQIDALRIDTYQNKHSIDTGVDTHGYPDGESGAIARIDDYFYASDRIANYKETRNGLDGWDFSSRLSAYLAHGCVSPSTVLAKLKEYESARVANESTYWLFFELLWREFFHLQQMKHGAKFFAFGGIQHKQPTARHDSASFKKWCSGHTGYDIIDACMRQLNASGFMSNRGRQLVASCFVHELNLDWRYGAAYFEQQLKDFDVASNWGNWQYLAGVGSDPRGHRQFNLQKQTDTYDPQRAFIKKWLNH